MAKQVIYEEDLPIKDDGFEYLGKHYDCQLAIERDIEMILQEAETSHKDSFDELYDRHSLKADKVCIFLDKEDNPIFGMVIYIIGYKEQNNGRYACGGYYPFLNDKLCPHPYQESICW